jgi:transglutaminase-like putative cysteine protease
MTTDGLNAPGAPTIDAVPAPVTLRATGALDFETPEVVDFVNRSVTAGGDPIKQAVDLYYAVRDDIRYEIYGIDLSQAGLRASAVVRTGSGNCMHKSILYAACLRSLGIPARLVLADVRNHLSSERLRDLMGGDVFRHHCFTTAYLGGRWVKATPVFNKALCKLYRMAQLDFDGVQDSVYHPFDLDGRRHMEILRIHGEFDDFPHARVLADVRAAHPGLLDESSRCVGGSLQRDAGVPGLECLD